MAAEERKRVRGTKELEAAYRQGFADGLEHALEEGRQQRELELSRARKMDEGLNGLRRALEAAPKRRRGRPEKRTEEKAAEPVIGAEPPK